MRRRPKPRRWRPRNDRSLPPSGWPTHTGTMLKPDPSDRRRRLIVRFGRIALALLAGAGAALAHPPFGILPGLLAYPLLMILAERSTTVRGGFWMGWLAGFAYFFIEIGR